MLHFLEVTYELIQVTYDFSVTYDLFNATYKLHTDFRGYIRLDVS